MCMSCKRTVHQWQWECLEHWDVIWDLWFEICDLRSVIWDDEICDLRSAIWDLRFEIWDLWVRRSCWMQLYSSCIDIQVLEKQLNEKKCCKYRFWSFWREYAVASCAQHDKSRFSWDVKINLKKLIYISWKIMFISMRIIYIMRSNF